MNSIKTNDIFLLTGAGFTKNFGGYLAHEMWAQMFNDSRIQGNPKLREVLQDNFDFESVYSTIIDGRGFSDEERSVMKEVVEDAYRDLDNSIRGWKFNSDSPYPVNIYGLGKLFNKIWPGPYNKPSLFFTLNQDLFVERRWGHPSPAAPRFKREFYDMHGQELNQSDFITLPKECSDEDIKDGLAKHNGIHYIKLHGSYGWRSSDGSNQLVIGTNKESLIKREQLLNKYINLLRSVVEEGNKKVLIIGYGFRDTHINNILLKGVQDHNLKIYIISTQAPADLRYQVDHGHYYARDIFNGLRGYFPYSLKEIFPGNQEQTTYFDNLVKSLTI